MNPCPRAENGGALFFIVWYNLDGDSDTFLRWTIVGVKRKLTLGRKTVFCGAGVFLSVTPSCEVGTSKATRGLSNEGRLLSVDHRSDVRKDSDGVQL